MSVAVCRSSSTPFHFQFENELIGSVFEPITSTPQPQMSNKGKEPPGQVDIWTMIQSQKASAPEAPYVHPLVRRSSSLMSQQSLEMCTESLGSESGSADFSSFFSDDVTSEPEAEEEEEEEKEEIEEKTVVQQEKGSRNGRKELSSVNYHCSISRRSPHRSFPPPLPSISRRNGLCIQMKPHRRDGRLVVEAVPVPSQNYLHARREHGRLLLSFIDATSHQPCNEADTIITEMLQLPKDLKVEEQAAILQESEEEEEEEEDDDDDVGEELEEEEEEEEEVEVVDRGTMVEVKVSTQPQQQNGAMKVHRSSLVINKFVGGTPKNQWVEELPAPRRLATTPTTAAAAAVAASSVSASSEEVAERMPATDNKFLFTSKRRNREELLHNMRRCSELRRPLFYFEPYCIATST